MSQLSGPLFTEDRYSTITDNNEENCDTEITTITQQWMPSQTTTMVMSPTRPVSTPSMADCSTQGDPDQTAPQGNHGHNQNNSTVPIQHTNNYLIPDGSDRCINNIQDKTFHRGILENGHNAYLVELPDLKSLLHTSRYLMDCHIPWVQSPSKGKIVVYFKITVCNISQEFLSFVGSRSFYFAVFTSQHRVHQVHKSMRYFH